MADQPVGPLADAARAIGSVAGKLVAAVTGDSAPAAKTAPAKKAKENLWQAEYIGSGTFIIHKPKRTPRKLHQQKVKNSRPGMR